MKNKVEIKQSEKLPCDLAVFTNWNCILDSGYKLENFTLAFKTYGKLNKKKNNAILICHALTGDQFIAYNNPITTKNG